MQPRHRIPTIFNIYMLDVVCCALGCVILLWQVANHDAEEQTAAAKEAQSDARTQAAAAKDAQADARTQASAAIEARKQFEKAQRDLTSASSDVVELRAALDDWQKKHRTLALALAMTEQERADARKLAADRQSTIDKTKAALILSTEQLRKLEADLAKRLLVQKTTNAALVGVQKVNADLLAKIALADKLIASLRDDNRLSQAELAKLLAEQKKTLASLTGAEKVNLELLAKLTASDKQLAALRLDLSGKDADLAAAMKKWQEQVALLKLSDVNVRKLQKLLDSLRDEHRDSQTKLKVAELQLKVREQDLERARKDLLGLLASKERLNKEMLVGVKDMADAKALIALLTAERDQYKDKLAGANLAVGSLKDNQAKLNQRVVDLQNQAEQRFAGIPLTGESVIFLIDISGSMAMKDEGADDPDKWPFLCETVMKLMRSIATMKRFQVILFSEKVTYLFGNRDQWLKYEGPKTAQMTRDALRKVKVEGGTNMHDAFDEAFRFRKLKLDTIYLFSDGLPNVGEGVPTNLVNPTEAQKNLHLAKHVRDKLKTDWNRPTEGLPGVRINAVGFFFESPDVGAFLWAMAREHHGSFVGLR